VRRPPTFCAFYYIFEAALSHVLRRCLPGRLLHRRKTSSAFPKEATRLHNARVRKGQRRRSRIKHSKHGYGKAKKVLPRALLGFVGRNQRQEPSYDCRRPVYIGGALNFQEEDFDKLFDLIPYGYAHKVPLAPAER